MTTVRFCDVVNVNLRANSLLTPFSRSYSRLILLLSEEGRPSNLNSFLDTIKTSPKLSREDLSFQK